VLGSIVVLGALMCGQDAEAARIIQRHEDALCHMHSFRATSECRRSSDGGNTWKLASRISYRRSGQKERIHETMYGGRSSGSWTESYSHRDLAYGPTEFRIMTGFDPENPPRLPLTGQESPLVGGAIYGPERGPSYGRQTIFSVAMMLVLMPNYTLKDLYNESKTKVVKPGRDATGGETWDFTLETPDKRFAYVISVSPDHNFAISKRHSTWRRGTAEGRKESISTNEVLEFYDYDFGLSFPKRIRSSNTADPAERFETVVTIESINAPIVEAELALEFPPGARVNDGVGMAYHVWGNGKPDLTFATSKEMNQWINEQDRRAVASGAHRLQKPWGYYVLAFSVLSLFLILLVLARSRLLRSVRSAQA
jgi:hypothetical protein